MTFRVRFYDDMHRDRKSLIVVMDTQEGPRAATSLTFEAFKEGEVIPTLLNGPDAVSFLQAIMDAAYSSGLRPSNARDERDKSAHLKDMREITRHLLKMDKS